MSRERRPRVVLLGFGPTAESALAGLRERFEVVALVRADPTGDDVVVAAARRAGAEVPVDTSVVAVGELVRRLRPDVVVVSSYDRVLPESLLGLCPFVNVHYAPLPRYRGRANVNWMILNGESEAAISVHTVAPGLDTGRILHQESVPIGTRDTVGDVYRALDAIQRHALPDAVQRHLDGDPGRAQDEASATYGCSRTPEDGEIDWSSPTLAIDRLVRALADPYPGAYTFLGLDVVRVLAATPVPDPPVYEGRIPGRVVSLDRAAGTVDVLTGDGALRIGQLRLEGGPVGPATDVVRSVRATLGLRTIDVVRRLAELTSLLEDRSLAPGHPREGGA